MAETLKLQASCAVFTTTRFSLLIYPSNAVWETWNFLEHGLPMVPEGTTLRFVIRKPLAHMAEPVINIAAQTIRDAEKNTSMLLRNTLGIEYDRLVKQPDPVLTAKSKSFFLFFVNKEHEYRIMYRFLEEHGADIYSWDTEGAWDYFCSKVDVGVILVSLPNTYFNESY